MKYLFFTYLLGSLWTTPASAQTGKACDLQRAARVYQTCAACHTSDANGKHGMAPNLRGVVGRGVGKAPGYPFSATLASEKDVWTLAKLNRFLEAPVTMYPKTSMAFSGLKKQEDRDAVLCQLEQMK